MLQLQPATWEFEPKGFKYYIVTVGTEGDIQFLDDYNARNVLLDPKADAFRAFNVSGIPETFVVDSQGKVYQDILGWRGDDSVKEMVSLIETLTGQ